LQKYFPFRVRYLTMNGEADRKSTLIVRPEVSKGKAEICKRLEG
jgi:hypothetical protein